MSTLGAEIAAQRLMAPFFGSSTVIWANTIAVVLLALSVGYWLGGRLADRRPSSEALYGLVLLGSALLAVVPFIAHPFLSLSVQRVRRPLGRRVHGLAVRDARARRGPAAAARRGVAVGDAAQARDGRGVGRRSPGGCTRSRRSARWSACSSSRCGRSRRSAPSARSWCSPRCPALVAALRPRRALRCSCRLALVAALALPLGHDQAGRRRARALRDRDAVPVRAGGRGGRRHAQARAQRGPGDPLAVAARHGADRRLLGRLPGAAVRDRLGAAAGADRRARHRRRDRAARLRALLSRTRGSTPSTSTRSCSRSAAATSAWRRGRSCASSPRTRGRSCAAPTSATTRSSSTPTASPTSRST